MTRTTPAAARDERGFTLIELLVTLLIVAILITIAVPSLIGFITRSRDGAAKANVRAALPAVEAYFNANDTYAGMDLTALRTIDTGVALDALVAAKQTATSYCVSATNGGHTWSKAGPGTPIVSGGC